MSDDAESALLALAGDLVSEIGAAKAVEMALALAAGLDSGAPRPPDWGMTRTQLKLASNNDAATPVVKGAKRYCDYCGGVDDLEPGPDQRHGLGDAWMCRDERQCIARRERRYPPDPSRVPAGLLDWAGVGDRAALAARQQEQAGPAAPEPGHGQRQPEPEYREPEGWQAGQYGAYDIHGQWHPALPPPVPGVPAYPHTIAGGAHIGHLLSGQRGPDRPHYYPGPSHIPVALYGTEGHEQTPGSAVPPVPQQGADGSQASGDGRFYQAARGQGDPMADTPMGPAKA